MRTGPHPEESIAVCSDAENVPLGLLCVAPETKG